MTPRVLKSLPRLIKGCKWNFKFLKSKTERNEHVQFQALIDFFIPNSVSTRAAKINEMWVVQLYSYNSIDIIYQYKQYVFTQLLIKWMSDNFYLIFYITMSRNIISKNKYIVNHQPCDVHFFCQSLIGHWHSGWITWVSTQVNSGSFLFS